MRRTRGLERSGAFLSPPAAAPWADEAGEEEGEGEDSEMILMPSSSPPAARVQPSGEKARERGGSAKRVATAANSHEGWE